MRNNNSIPCSLRSHAALILMTLTIHGCATIPCLQSDDARRICEHLYQIQQLRGDGEKVVTPCYEAIRDEIGLDDRRSLPTR